MFNREQPQPNDENPNDASLDRHLKQENIINCFDDLHELSIVNEEKENSFQSEEHTQKIYLNTEISDASKKYFSKIIENINKKYDSQYCEKDEY